MKFYTGFEYLLMDIASQMGHDKLLFGERLQWTIDHINELEALAEGKVWKERPLYLRAVQELRKIQSGKPSGYMVGLDAVCSGAQIMSVLTGCITGATATGLVDPERRADAYTDCTTLVEREVGQALPNSRKSTKNAFMTYLYGSIREPEKEFGEGSPALQAFYKAMFTLAPGACELLEDLRNTWNSQALVHSWKLPDGFDARVKVEVDHEDRLRVDELGGASFTYLWKENAPVERDCKNIANTVHSVDAYVLRSLIRRCSYDKPLVKGLYWAISDELIERALGNVQQGDRYGLGADDDDLKYYVQQYQRSTVADIVILPYLYAETICCLSTEHLASLKLIMESMLEHEPFHVITVHDEFKCLPNYLNHLRIHYRNILAELADSRLVDDLLSQLYGFKGTFRKKSQNLGDLIRKSQYALC